MISLSDYQSFWPIEFSQEKTRLQTALRNALLAIEHIGSTAIPGISAKPIIDIMIGVNDLSHIGAPELKTLADLGYRYIPEFESELPHRRFFQKENAQGKRTHHIHLVRMPSAWWTRHLLFRDYLRENTAVAQAYEAHKKMLAPQFELTRDYARAKTAFVEKINIDAYFDFDLHKPIAETARLIGYFPQPACFELYQQMFQDPEFIACYGVHLNDEKLRFILERDAAHADAFGYGPLVWFSKETGEFVGEGGLKECSVEGVKEIELTYSLNKKYWGQGFAPEIGRWALDQAFRVWRLPNVVCFTRVGNTQSLRVMEKLGFQYEKDFMHSALLHRLYRINGIVNISKVR